MSSPFSVFPLKYTRSVKEVISLRRFLAFLLILLSLLLAACGQSREAESYSLTVWYVEGEPLAPVFAQLAEEYNRARGKNSLSVTLRAWEDSERMLNTLQSSAPPALILCNHAFAFTLEELGLLKDSGFALSAYPNWLLKRADCVGRGFYPIGHALPLLCTREPLPASLTALADAAARYGRETGLPGLYVEQFAPLFYQALLDEGTEFGADPERDRYSEHYVNLYNAIMRTAFDRGLAWGAAVYAPYRLESSVTLVDRALDGFTIVPLSEEPLFAEGHGLAVTVRDTRMRRALPDFLRWLTQPGRMGSAALRAGLVPAVQEPLSPTTPLEIALSALRERPLHLPDAECRYYVNRSAFEDDFLAALALLH